MPKKPVTQYNFIGIHPESHFMKMCSGYVISLFYYNIDIHICPVLAVLPKNTPLKHLFENEVQIYLNLQVIRRK